jgi:hypothetical protein
MQTLYNEMTSRIDCVVMSSKVPEEFKASHKGFLQWKPEMTSKSHPPIVQVTQLPLQYTHFNASFEPV